MKYVMGPKITKDKLEGWIIVSEGEEGRLSFHYTTGYTEIQVLLDRFVLQWLDTVFNTLAFRWPNLACTYC